MTHQQQPSPLFRKLLNGSPWVLLCTVIVSNPPLLDKHFWLAQPGPGLLEICLNGRGPDAYTKSKQIYADRWSGTQASYKVHSVTCRGHSAVDVSIERNDEDGPKQAMDQKETVKLSVNVSWSSEWGQIKTSDHVPPVLRQLNVCFIGITKMDSLSQSCNSQLFCCLDRVK